MKQKHNRKKEKYTRIACENIIYEWLQLGNLFSLYRVCVCFSSCFSLILSPNHEWFSLFKSWVNKMGFSEQNIWWKQFVSIKMLPCFIQIHHAVEMRKQNVVIRQNTKPTKKRIIQQLRSFSQWRERIFFNNNNRQNSMAVKI